jgi:hypothetical protein
MINNTHAFNRSGSLLSAEPRSQGDPADSGVKAVVINQLVNHPTLVWKSGCWYLKLLEMAIDFLEISIVLCLLGHLELLSGLEHFFGAVLDGSAKWKPPQKMGKQCW